MSFNHIKAARQTLLDSFNDQAYREVLYAIPELIASAEGRESLRVALAASERRNADLTLVNEHLRAALSQFEAPRMPDDPSLLARLQSHISRLRSAMLYAVELNWDLKPAEQQALAWPTLNQMREHLRTALSETANLAR